MAHGARVAELGQRRKVEGLVTQVFGRSNRLPRTSHPLLNLYVTGSPFKQSPAFGRKHRPAQVMHVIPGPMEYEILLAILMDKSGTLGVRVLDRPRLVAERDREVRRLTVGDRPFGVQVKTSTVDARTITVKPEYEDLRRVALDLGRPLYPVDEEVRAQLGGWTAR